MKRRHTAARNSPKAISRWRRVSRWAKITPKCVVISDVGMVKARVASDTKPTASGGRSLCPQPAAMYPRVPGMAIKTPTPADVEIAR